MTRSRINSQIQHFGLDRFLPMRKSNLLNYMLQIRPQVYGKLILFFVFIVGIAFISDYFMSQHLDATPFHGDESGWIAAGNYYAELVLRRDFTWEKWDCWECGHFVGAWGSLNPPLGKLVFGIPLALDPRVKVNDQKFSGYYVWTMSRDDNAAAGNIPPQEVLLKARRISLLFGVLSCLLLFIVGYYSVSWQVGTIAALLLLTNTVFLNYATRAMPDVFNGFLLLSVCLVGIFLLKVQGNKNILVLSILTGILAGLAGSVKITGLVISGLFFLIIIAYRQTMLGLNRKRLVLRAVAFALAALSVTYVVNPYYWPSFARFNFGSVTEEIRQFSQEVYRGRVHKDDFKQLYSEAAFRVVSNDIQRESLRQQYPQLSDLSHPFELPIVYLRWSKWLDFLTIVNGDKWNGNRLNTIHRAITIEYSTIPASYIFLLFIGIVVCIFSTIKSFKRKQVIYLTVPFVFFIVNYLFISALIKNNVDRYYLPTILASQIMAAVGISTAITMLFRYCRKLAVKISGWELGLEK